MNQKRVGIIIIIIGIVIGSIFVMYKTQQDSYVDLIVDNTGTCFLEDGTCLHKKNSSMFTVGMIISILLILFGIFLAVFDKVPQEMKQQQHQFTNALRAVKKTTDFQAFLKGFSPDEQKVLEAVKDQEGILQSTLRFRTGISKASLSVLLKNLEEREFINREVSGKTKKVYLQKKF